MLVSEGWWERDAGTGVKGRPSKAKRRGGLGANDPVGRVGVTSTGNLTRHEEQRLFVLNDELHLFQVNDRVVYRHAIVIRS